MNKTAIILSFLLGMVIGCNNNRKTQVPSPPEIIVRHDTIRIQKPVPVTISTVDTVFISAGTGSDTVQIPLPIEQKEYYAPEYTAWVSGYRPALDSLHLHIPVTERAVLHSEAPRRISIGIQAGYGITPRGLQPYIGLGVAYRLL